MINTQHFQRQKVLSFSGAAVASAPSAIIISTVYFMDGIRYLNLLFSVEKLIVSKLFVVRRQRIFHIAFSHFQVFRFSFHFFFVAEKFWRSFERRCNGMQMKDSIKKLIIIFR